MKTLTLRIWGQASQRTIAEFNISPDASENQQTLMDYLRARAIPIASSCQGAGICRKCNVNDGLLSCQITLDQMLQNAGADHSSELLISVAYL